MWGHLQPLKKQAGFLSLVSMLGLYIALAPVGRKNPVGFVEACFTFPKADFWPLVTPCHSWDLGSGDICSGHTVVILCWGELVKIQFPVTSPKFTGSD